MEDNHHNRIDEEPARRTFYVGWPLMLFLGWLVFDLTADAALTALVACAKFGWNDWLTARWLRKTDPAPRRAAACAWFYRASATWKIALAATVGMFLLAYVQIMAFGPQAPGRELAVIASEAVFGFVLATLLTTAASFLAWRAGQRVWISRQMHLLRRHEIWPPFGLGPRNGIPTLLTTATMTWLAPLGVFILFAAFLPPRQPRVQTWLTIGMIVGMFAGAVLVLTLRELVSQRISAKTPRECWPEMDDIHGTYER